MSDKSENSALPVEKNGAQAAVLAAPAKRPASSVFTRILLGVLTLAVIALGVLLALAKEKLIFQDPPEPPVSYSVTCYVYGGDPLSVTALAGETVSLPEAPPLDGYTFLCWADANGNPAEGNEVTLYENLSFSAVYAIAFRDQSKESVHEPYFSIDGAQLFHPAGSVKRGEAISILYSFLDTELVGSGVFTDVSEDAGCYTAAATLKDLGVLSGSRLHPDDPITFSELFAILSHFVPAPTEDYSFENIPQSDTRYAAFCLAMQQGWLDDTAVNPDRDLTRAEAACIFNRLSGRGAIAERDNAKVGTILDISMHDPYYWDIVESAVPHEAESTPVGELWTHSSPLARHEEGLFFIGTELHCADASGSAVVNGSYGNFDFGPDGVITTGMPELDRYVQATLKELVDPATMEPERMLYILYNYVTYHNSYLRVNYYEVGDISWVNDEAYYMFTVGKGNCYCYAAQFYVLAKAIGFDAKIYSGTVDTNSSPHAWVEIEIDGVPYVYDTEMEYTQVVFSDGHGSFYKMPLWKAEKWQYYRGEETAAEG